MDIKKVFLLFAVSTLLIGSVCAAGVNDFKVDSSYKEVYSGDYYAVYADSSQDSGISIYKNVDDDVYDDIDNDDILEGVIHHDGREYITPDDDLKLNMTDNDTANFTDYEHATHGLSEVVKSGGDEYVVVFWAKDSSNVDFSKLMSNLDQFNKDNKAELVLF